MTILIKVAAPKHIPTAVERTVAGNDYVYNNVRDDQFADVCVMLK